MLFSLDAVIRDTLAFATLPATAAVYAAVVATVCIGWQRQAPVT